MQAKIGFHVSVNSINGLSQKGRYCGNVYSLKYDNKQPITEDYLTNLKVPVSKSVANKK